MRLSSKALIIGLVIVFGLVAVRYSFGEEQQGKPSPPPASMQKTSHGELMDMAGKHAQKMHKPSCLRSLQLDEKQREELRKIYQTHKAEINNLWSEQDEKLSALESAIKGGDEQSVRKAFQDLSKVRENILVLRLSMLKEIKKILNDNQKSQFDACIQQRFDRFHRRWEGELMRFLNE